MPKSVHITAPWPTLEEMVKDLDIPADRRAELDASAYKAFVKIEDDRKASSGEASGREEKPRNASAAD
jgi:hypothetical protein